MTDSITGSPFRGAFNRLDQNLIGGWRGSFALGDALIYTGGATIVTLDFSTPTVAAGVQVQPATVFAAFATRIEALDAGGIVLASFEVTGASTAGEDNSAPFLGIRATGGTAFAKIRLTNMTVMSYPGIAINRVDFSPIGANSSSKLKAQGVVLVNEADEKTTGPGGFMAVDADGNPILVDQHV